MTDAQKMLELAARLHARAEEIDNRLGPIPGRDADRIAVELREAAAALRALTAIPVQETKPSPHSSDDHPGDDGWRGPPAETLR